MTSRAFPPLKEVFRAYGKMAGAKAKGGRGVFWGDVGSSLTSAGIGFALGFVIGVPVAFLMAWYRPIRYIIEPWIQFIRNIPPLAYVPLVVIAAGVGRAPQIIVICLATFLTITITVFQGVINVDETLIKAARVLGANDAVLFIKVIFPATMPWEEERKTCFFITHDVEEAILLASRVVIMSARPGRIKEVIDIDIPYPRDQETKMLPRFTELKNHT